MTSPMTLLYVDDDPDIRAIVRMALSLDPAIAPRIVASGETALALVAKSNWRPDVVILDVLMPGMSGVETLQALRELPWMASVPAVFMTAKGREADMARYAELAVAGTILKPFDPLRLAGDIRALIGRA